MDTQTIINSLKTFEAENTATPTNDGHLVKFYGVKQWDSNNFSVLQSSIVKQLKEAKPEVLKFTFGDNVILVNGRTLTDLVALYPDTRFDFEYIPPQPPVSGMVEYTTYIRGYNEKTGKYESLPMKKQEERIIKDAIDCQVKLSFTDGKVKNTCYLYNIPDGFKLSVREVTLQSDSKPEETETSKDKVQAIAINGVTHVLPSSLRAAMKGEKFVKLADSVYFATADLRKILKSAILVSFFFTEGKRQAVAIATSKHEENAFHAVSEVSSPMPETYNARRKRDDWNDYGNLEFSIYTAYEPVSQDSQSFNILSRGAYLADCFFARHPEYDSEKVRQVTAKIVKGMRALVKPNTPKATIKEINQFEYMGKCIANARYQSEYAGEVTMLYWEDGFSIEFDEVGMKHLEKVNQIMMYRTLNSRWFSQNGTTFTSVNSGGWAETYQKLLTELPQKGFTIAHASTGILDDNGRYQMAEVY